MLAACIRILVCMEQHASRNSLDVPAALVNNCLRWRRRRHGYRPAGEPLRTERYSVEPIEETPAKSFVIEHHYSGSYPAARFRAGMFEHGAFHKPQLVGVAVFSVPMTQALIPKYLGVPAIEGVELGRLVLLDDVAANGETWFLARAFRLLRKSLVVRGVVTFCDPLARHDAQGREVKRSHTGVIYRSHNATAAGRTLARTQLLMPNGLCASDRTLSKIRNEERGVDYAMRQLRDAGAPGRCLGETPAQWLARLRQEGFFRSVRHPGNFAFTWRF